MSFEIINTRLNALEELLDRLEKEKSNMSSDNVSKVFNTRRFIDIIAKCIKLCKK